MAEINWSERTDDAETIAFPVSAEDATALNMIINTYIHESEIDLTHRKATVKKEDLDNQEIIELQEYLIEKAKFLLSEVIEINKYFADDEQQKKESKIIIPKPNWNGSPL